MQKATDLAYESFESRNKSRIDGVIIREQDGISVVEVTNENGARELAKPVGKYITYTLPCLVSEAGISEALITKISKLLYSLLPSEPSSALVTGIGNADITADALGPMVNNYILPTRHIKDSQLFDKLLPVSSVSTGVMGDTGIESGELIKGIANIIKPDVIIAVDALAASSKDRLGTTIQLSNAGISPGSGVGNHRFEITKATIGVPVIAIGIPTVLSTARLDNASDGELFVTPREIDGITRQGAKLIGMAINTCLQKSLSYSELLALVI